MTYSIIYSNKFKKSLKKCFKRGLDIEKLREVLRILEQGKTLPSEYKAHKLFRQISRILGMPHSTRLASCLGAKE